jgi:hypothetical protein
MNKIEDVGEAIHQMMGTLASAKNADAIAHNWLIDVTDATRTPEKREESRNAPADIIWLIGEWAHAKDMEYQIDTMSPERKAKELQTKLFEDKTYDDLVKEEIEVKVGITVTDEDEDYGPLFREALNGQLQKRLDYWEETLKDAEDGLEEFERTDPFFMCDERDILEYAAAGIEILRLENHLLDLPYYKEYCKRLKELDAIFKNVLNGQTVYRPCADKLFWWRQK